MDSDPSTPDKRQRAPGPTSSGSAGVTRRDLVRTGALAGASLSATALVAACGGGSSAGSTATGTSVGGPARHGGTLRVGLPAGGPNDTLDGLRPLLIPDFARAYELYDRFMVNTPHTEEPENSIVSELESTKNGTEWTLRLRDGIEFHDGKPAGAEDVIYTFKRVLNPKTGAAAAVFLQYVEPATLRKLDPLTVRFNLMRPFAMPLALARKEIVLQPVGFDPQRPIGTGPFKYVSFTPGNQSVFAANRNYWQGAPYVDELVMIDITDDTARLNAMLGGEIDMMVSVPYGSVPTVKSASNAELIVNPSGAWYPIVMNCKAPPFTDVRVRQAMRLIADREKMIEIAYLGYGRLGNDLYGIGDPLYDTSLPQRVPDIEQARSLLKQAGQLDTVFTRYAANLGAGDQQSCQVFAASAQAAGVNVKVQEIDVSTYDAKFGEWPFVDGQWGDNGYTAAMMLSDGPDSPYPETHFGAVDAQFAQLATELIGELDVTRQKELASEMQRVQYERGGYLVWSFQTLVDAASKRVRGYTLDNSGYSFGSYNLRTVYFV